jgi:hypothetical protein
VIRAYLRETVLPPDWAGDHDDSVNVTGELCGGENVRRVPENWKPAPLAAPAAPSMSDVETMLMMSPSPCGF